MTTPEQTQPTRDRDIYQNFATPLAGTFLNLPQHGVVLKCPACGVKGESVLQHDLKWWASELNCIVGCLFVCVFLQLVVNLANPCPLPFHLTGASAAAAAWTM